MRRFEGSTVVVTGASRGLGRAIALAFGREGAHVCVGFRTREADAEGTLAAITAAGGAGQLLGFDVRELAGVEAALEKVLAGRGAIDVLVNNAGVLAQAPFALASREEWDAVQDTNLGGIFNCCRAVVRPMLARRKGTIVNVASAAALRSAAGLSAYSASKAGVLSLTRGIAMEVAGRGVRVNAVVPGFLSTGMGSRLERRTAERSLAQIPSARFGTAEEVAAAVLFLASDDASYLVGHALVVDGGLSL